MLPCADYVRLPGVAAEFGAHARIRTGDLFLTKEVLKYHFPIGSPLRSNAEAIANNRCLAALPRKRPTCPQQVLRYATQRVATSRPA